MMMLYKKYTLFSLISVIYVGVLSLNASIMLTPFLNFKQPELLVGEQTKGVKTFFSAIEAKKSELAQVKDDLIKFKTRVEDIRKTLTDPLSQISYELTQAKDDLEKSDQQRTEFINKKITILNDRKQNLTNYQELFKLIEDTYVARINKLKEYVDFLQTQQKTPLKPLYSWEEFREEQKGISEIAKTLDESKSKKDALVRQDLTEKETIASLQKQIEVKIKERDKNITENKLVEKADDKTVSLKALTDIFNEEISLAKEKINNAQLKVEHLGLDIKLKENEIDFTTQKLSYAKSNLTVMEKRLSIEQHDVEIARNEAAAERQKALLSKEEINKKIEIKNLLRGKLEIRRDLAINQRKKIESRDKTLDSPEFRVAKSEEQKAIYNFKNVDQIIKVLSIKNARADTDADDKDLLYQMVELRFKLTQSKIDLEEFCTKFKSSRDLVVTALRKLNLDRQEVMNSLVEDTKELEILNLRLEEVTNLKDTLFKNNNTAFQIILKNIDITEKALHEHMKTSHDLLVGISELIVSKEKIINKYNLIIQDLENHILDQGIWKRSPRAISLEAFLTSLVEAESFLIDFFWDTPAHLGPLALIGMLKKITTRTILNIVLFVLFFIGSFVGIRFLLMTSLRRVRYRLSIDHKHFRFLSLNIIASLLEFLIDHAKLIFSLIFIYTHIAFNFRYIFSTIDFIALPYYLALFHLASIPSFVYLSQHLLTVIKDLNKRLSFLFFAEKLQDRFILLITSFCYSTVIIIPFRQAFLSYPTNQSGTFADVLLTAYSLILVIILLLFFSKEDVLRFLPSRGNVLFLIKQGIEQHYYPVFFFLMGLLIISNPYIGYSNLAWFLAFAVPSTVLLFYAVLMVHYYVRKYAIFLFMKEEDEEIVDKFEYAKTFYGLLVIFSFLFLMFSALSIAAHLWRFGYSPAGIWKLFSDTLVIRVGVDHKFGFLEFLTLVLFVAGGFVVSSFIQRFILNKLFDILRTEPGMQNTISKILHYTTISLSLLIGFTSVHLDQLLVYIAAVSAVAIGFVLKDVAADYISGLFILIERPLEIGNYVRLDQDDQRQGTVHKIDARTTTIINKFNHALIIPNKDITNKLVSNWGKGRFAVGFEIMIAVDYHSDVLLVRETIIEVVQSNPTILRVPRIIVRMESFNDTNLTFLARAFISSRRVREQWDIAADLRENIFRAFREKGINFAYPQSVVHFARDVYPDEQAKPKDPISFKF